MVKNSTRKTRCATLCAATGSVAAVSGIRLGSIGDKQVSFVGFGVRMTLNRSDINPIDFGSRAGMRLLRSQTDPALLRRRPNQSAFHPGSLEHFQKI